MCNVILRYPLRIPASLIVAISLLGGCASTGEHVADWGEITLSPGDTGTCSSSPCRVYFRMPPGEGTYRVTGTGFTIGDYPAGETVMIGSFFQSSAIKVVDAGVPPAYIWVADSSGDVH